jgi:hypothetical protein
MVSLGILIYIILVVWTSINIAVIIMVLPIFIAFVAVIGIM